jgi:hypothetical protein
MGTYSVSDLERDWFALFRQPWTSSSRARKEMSTEEFWTEARASMQVSPPRCSKGRLLLTYTQRLGNVCLRILSVPPGIASVERSFSLLRALDTKQRNRMKDSTLRDAFFLRANAFLFSAPPIVPDAPAAPMPVPPPPLALEAILVHSDGEC